MTKKNLYIISAIALVVVGAVLWFIFGPKTIQENQNNNTAEEISLLSVINSDVSVKDLDQADYQEVTKQETNVAKGTKVKTSLTGRALIQSPSGSTVVVDKNSEFQVVSSDPNKTSLNLVMGNLWAKVKKVFGKGEYYQIKTHNAVATVRGTSFGVFYDAPTDTTTVLVGESQVIVVSIDPITGLIIGKEVLVDANHKAVVTTGKPAELRDVTQADKNNEWYRFNQQEVTGAAPSLKDSNSNTSKTNNSQIPQTSGQASPQGPSTGSTSSAQSGQSAASGTGSTAPNSGGSQGALPSSSPSSTQTVPASPSTTTENQGSAFAQPAGNKPVITSVDPNTVFVSQGQNSFTIKGEHLDKPTNVFVGDFAVSFVSRDSNTITVTVSRQIPPGTYNVSVALANNEIATLPQSLTIR